MKPGGPLKRNKPLQAKTGLRRNTPLQQSSDSVQPGARALLRRVAMKASSPKPKFTSVQKRPLLERSGGVCEIGTSACGHIATDVCHRRGEKAGGRHGAAAQANDRLSNVLHGCRSCHRLATEYPKTALLNGWRLLETTDPLTAPVNRRGRLVLLDDEGGVFDAGTRDRVA